VLSDNAQAVVTGAQIIVAAAVGTEPSPARSSRTVLLLTLREITRRVHAGSGVALRCVLSHVCSSTRVQGPR
jgi:hypothetical protein